MPKYRVTHGDVVQGGKSNPKGAVLEMSDADAAELGAAVELVKEVPEAKHHEPKPLATELRPAVEAPPKPPRTGKDKTK